jgi:2-polyprenyl-6-methoxyphenol hydroxylase-like FAD-dependent oxidoreductase
MPLPLKISIIGAGFAGLASALLLARQGHSVQVYEKFPDPKPVGAGILIQPTGLWAMRRLGIETSMLDAGAKVDWLYGVNPRGRAVIDIHYKNWRPESFGLGLHRGALFNALWNACARAGVYVHAGVAIDGLREQANGVVLSCGSQSFEPADLVVVSDGSHSVVRAQLGLAVRSEPYAWGALWAVVPSKELGKSQTLLQWYRLANEMLGVMPTGIDPNTGQPSVSLFWSVRYDRHEAVVAQGLAAWRQQVLALAPSVAPVLNKINAMSELTWARYYDVVMPQYHTPRCVVIGDAAHATSPQLGQGTNLALMDAVTLADCLQGQGAEINASSLAQALARFTEQRKGHLHFYGQASRFLTPFFQSDWRLIPWMRDLFLAQSARLPFLKGVNHQTLVGVRKSWLGGELDLDDR